MVQYYVFEPGFLQDFCSRVFVSFGVSEEEALLASEVLSMADLRGIDSHGIARLKSYVEMFSIGRLNPSPVIKVIRDKKSVATVDGDGGLGLIVGPKANEIAMEKASAHGSGWVSVCNTNHYGIASYYSLKALERDMIGWSMTNTSSIVSPLWGAQSMLGTNPIAIAFPGLKNPPIVIDFATSVVALGKVEIARRQGKAIPKGWLVNQEGFDTEDPNDMFDGSLLPLGSTREMGGHKGYCMASMVDILCGVLSGANWGPYVPQFAMYETPPEKSVGKGIGHFFGAMEIDGFEEVGIFKRRIDQWIEEFRATPPISGQQAVLIPGDPEHSAERKRRQGGIPIIQAVLDDLLTVAKLTKVKIEWEKHCLKEVTSIDEFS